MTVNNTQDSRVKCNMWQFTVWLAYSCCCVGLANIASVCDPRRSTSINQENGEYADIQTAAHELGHKSVDHRLSICIL